MEKFIVVVVGDDIIDESDNEKDAIAAAKKYFLEYRDDVAVYKLVGTVEDGEVVFKKSK